MYFFIAKYPYTNGAQINASFYLCQQKLGNTIFFLHEIFTYNNNITFGQFIFVDISSIRLRILRSSFGHVLRQNFWRNFV